MNLYEYLMSVQGYPAWAWKFNAKSEVRASDRFQRLHTCIHWSFLFLFVPTIHAMLFVNSLKHCFRLWPPQSGLSGFSKREAVTAVLLKRWAEEPGQGLQPLNLTLGLKQPLIYCN